MLCLLLGVLAAACGGGGDTGSTSAAAPAGSTAEGTTSPEAEGGASTSEGGESTTEGGNESTTGGKGSQKEGGGSTPGQDGSRGESEGIKPESGSPPSGGRAALIRQGEAICARAKRRQLKSATEYRKKQEGSSISGKADLEELISKAALPPIATAIEELNDLEAGEAASEFGAIVTGLEEALAAAEANPISVLNGSKQGSFAEVDGLAKEFGFKTCAQLA